MSAETQGAETYEPRELPPEIDAAWLAYGEAVNRVHRVAWNDVRGFEEALGDAPHRLREAIADALAAVERELLEARTDRDAYSDDVDALREELCEGWREWDEARQAWAESRADSERVEWLEKKLGRSGIGFTPLALGGGWFVYGAGDRRGTTYPTLRAAIDHCRAALAARSTETPEGR